MRSPITIPFKMNESTHPMYSVLVLQKHTLNLHVSLNTNLNKAVIRWSTPTIGLTLVHPRATARWTLVRRPSFFPCFFV